MEGSVVDVFASGAYWREYYTSLGHENREVGEFLAEVTREISPAAASRSSMPAAGRPCFIGACSPPAATSSTASISATPISPTHTAGSQRRAPASSMAAFWKPRATP